MNNIMELRLAEYDSNIDRFRELETIVLHLLEEQLKGSNIRPMQIAHRIKTRESVAGKMERKPDKYSAVLKMTDLLGIRIICYFSDQVNQVAELIRKCLVIDNSVDKRKILDPTSFGYLSLHCICSLPKDAGYPEDLCDLKFEIQIRTVLQHTWAEIEHDLGYKSEFGIPQDLRRNFSRVAGLLEFADEAFLQIRQNILEYEAHVKELITNDEADAMPLDLVSLKAYLEFSKTMQSLIREIAALSGSTVNEVSPEQYLRYLEFFDIHTLGDLNAFVQEGYEDAVSCAKRILNNIQLDEVSSIIGLYYLCRARLIHGDYTEEQLMQYFMLGEAAQKKAKLQTGLILRLRASDKADQGKGDTECNTRRSEQEKLSN